MDELVIDDKKYISSKQAAKLTGYAKDYVGQLCREGRVSARLVGRSWYVLESAIQDHRFGDTPQEARRPVQVTRTESAPPTPTAVVSASWEAPRYEPTQHVELPPLNRIEREEVHEDISENQNLFVDDFSSDTNNTLAPEYREEKAPIQNTWSEWESKIERQVEPGINEEIQHSGDTTEEYPLKEEVPSYQRQEASSIGTTMPIRVYEPITYGEQEGDRTPSKGKATSYFFAAAQVMSVLFALIVASVALINSGKLDEYIASDSRVNFLAGISEIKNI